MPFLCKGLIYYHSHEAWISLILTLNSTSFPLPYIIIIFYFAKCNLAFYLTRYNIVCHNIFSNNENAEIIQFSLWLLLWYFWLETYGGSYLLNFFNDRVIVKVWLWKWIIIIFCINIKTFKLFCQKLES